MMTLAIFVGAGVGGVARYAVGTWVQAAAGPTFPWGTLFVNASGSLVLALAYTFLEGTAAAPEWRAFLGVGVIGGYTTFSTFSYETLRLLQDGEWSRALLYVVTSVGLSLVGAILGLGIGSLLLRRG